MSWKYRDAARRIAERLLASGAVESCLAASLPEGTVIAEPDPPPPPTQDELDTEAARQYAKLQALRAMSPAQVSSWVDANITDLASAKDALKTLAIAVGILARRL